MEILKATYDEIKGEVRAWWFILKTQPFWFTVILAVYVTFWRIPVGGALSLVALTIALISIAVRTVYETIAPKVQGTWIPDPDAFSAEVKIFRKQAEAKLEKQRIEDEKGMR